MNILNYAVNKIYKAIHRIRRPLYQDNLAYKGDVTSLLPITVLIPVIEKDLEILSLCIQNLRQFCQNPIYRICVISPISERIQNACKTLNVTWINENQIAPVNKEIIHELLGDPVKVNWFYQQFLKLNFDTIVETEHYLVLDSDTILLVNQYFVSDQHMILKVSDEYHYLYQNTNKALIKNIKISFQSFIAHHQLINKSILADLKRQISQENDKALWEKLLFTIKNNNNWFSEYELYGSFASQFYKNKIKTVYWYNRNQYRKHFSKMDLQELSRSYASVSFHNYNYEIHKKNSLLK